MGRFRDTVTGLFLTKAQAAAIGKAGTVEEARGKKPDMGVVRHLEHNILRSALDDARLEGTDTDAYLILATAIEKVIGK